MTSMSRTFNDCCRESIRAALRCRIKKPSRDSTQAKYVLTLKGKAVLCNGISRVEEVIFLMLN
jgi:hypothetical protein